MGQCRGTDGCRRCIRCIVNDGAILRITGDVDESTGFDGELGSVRILKRETKRESGCELNHNEKSERNQHLTHWVTHWIDT